MEEEKKNKTITILDKDYVQWVQELSKCQRAFLVAIFIIAILSALLSNVGICASS